MLSNFDAEREFLQAIAESPEDDTPRLIYADWLEEQGDLRAEFVRVQIEIAHLGDFPDPKLLHPLSEREDQLWVSLRPIRQHYYALGVMDFEFRRGVLEGIGVQAMPFVENAEAIFRGAPVLSKLDLLAVQDVFKQILKVPQFEQINRLRVGGRFEEEQVRAFRDLLGNSKINDLEISWFSANHEVQFLNKIAPQLKRFVVSRTLMPGSDLHFRGEFPLLAELRLPRCQLPSPLSAQWLESLNPDSLRILDLSGSLLTEQSRNFLTERFRNLEVLITDDLQNFEHFAQAAWLPSLKQLECVTFNSDTFAQLMRLPLESVRELSFQLSSDVTWKSFQKNLCESELTPRLYHVSVMKTKITKKQFDMVCDELTKVPGWEAKSKRTFTTTVGKRTF